MPPPTQTSPATTACNTCSDSGRWGWPSTSRQAHVNVAFGGRNTLWPLEGLSGRTVELGNVCEGGAMSGKGTQEVQRGTREVQRAADARAADARTSEARAAEASVVSDCV